MFQKLVHAATSLVLVVGVLAGAVPARAAPTDTTKPVVGPFNFSENPWPRTTQPPFLTITPTDDASGVALAEFYFGDNDPGVGLASSMEDLGNGSFRIGFSGETPPSVTPVHIRVQDGAGNWSDTAYDYFVAYDISAPTITGKKTIVPTLAAGDLLPGLIQNGQTDKAKFGFTVKYNSQGVIASASDFMFAYETGTKCNKPAQAVNCHSLSLNASSFAWLVVDGSNLSRGVFQGTAAVTVDGTTTTNLFRVTGIDGIRLDPTSDDSFTLAIFAPGAGANTTPLYQTSQPIARGNIRVHSPLP
jgi:hypothetical protein